MKNTKKEELFFLGDLYSIVKDGDFSNITNEEVDKLLTIINTIYNIGNNHKNEKIIKFFKECQSIQKENCNQKEFFVDDFYLHQESWKNLILQEIANKFSIAQEERDKFCHFMKDYLEDVILEKKDIFKIVENKEYLNYEPCIKPKYNWHYIWLWTKEIIALIVALSVYNFLVEPFEIISISILFLIYLTIQYNHVVDSWQKIIERRLVKANVKKLRILMNDIPNKEEIDNIKIIYANEEKYAKIIMIKNIFRYIWYFIVLYNLFISLFLI